MSHKKFKRSDRVTNVFITWNHYPKGWKKIVKRKLKAQWFIGQPEIGENGTPHIQGLMGFKQRRFGPLHDLVPEIHYERIISPRAAAEYVQKVDTKDGKVWKHGPIPEFKPGKRNDIKEFVAACKEQAATPRLIEEFPALMLRYPNGVSQMRSQLTTPRDYKTTVLIFHGVSGSGKTKLAREFPAVYKVPSINSQLFLGGYDPNTHQTVLFDDFYGGIQWSELLQLMDRYPHEVHTKGGFTQFKPLFIIFTSNSPPVLWYPNMAKDPAKWAAFERRVDYDLLFGDDSITINKGELKNLPMQLSLPLPLN